MKNRRILTIKFRIINSEVTTLRYSKYIFQKLVKKVGK